MIMPFKQSTAKKYARLVLKWVLPIGFALIPLNGCYRSFTEVGVSAFHALYFMYSWIILVGFVVYLVFLGLRWVYNDN